MNSSLLLTGSSNSWVTIIIYVVVFAAFMYFIIIKPQKKQQQKAKALLSSLEIGDSILTSSGFYGVVIDITDDTVIVEFGNNKNCRIPMQKAAIVQVEKTTGATEVQ
ncbi:preprotein translocase subunit YajC [Parasporobacterium paucivorans]|uniref:Preprotein translocase subunit YajC n=1 Tax=Parasporobacterium paucivorans DSM 15970 TaxID=1122934 RepID=A0A1M6C470_9FIRM|nr:preprotein translocase subunit YajC [Parasporobacterium paucivorans]SHI55820.1 preprotein translocase subunit YajC [Parasporobacterium paucivorans DSM 15970]